MTDGTIPQYHRQDGTIDVRAARPARSSERRSAAGWGCVGSEVECDHAERRGEDGHCGEWLAKFDEQLAALDSGGDLTEVRTQVNDTVQKLASAIRKSFPT